MIALIFNPAKNTRAFETALQLLAASHIEYAVYQTASREDTAIQTRQAVADGAELIVACGGDGTLLWVINALYGSSIPLAILPIGCSNDFAKQLGIYSVENAVCAIEARRFVEVDLMECTFHDCQGQQQMLYFNSTGGVGILANIFRLERYSWVEWAKRVFKDAIWPLLCLHALFTTRPQATDCSIDDDTFRAVIPLVEITKTARNGGFTFISSATPTSGRLHAWYIRDASKFTLLGILCRVVLGRSCSDERAVFSVASSSLSVVPETPFSVHLNGDLVGQTPAHFSMGSHRIAVAGLIHER